MIAHPKEFRVELEIKNTLKLSKTEKKKWRFERTILTAAQRYKTYDHTVGAEMEERPVMLDVRWLQTVHIALFVINVNKLWGH